MNEDKLVGGVIIISAIIYFVLYEFYLYPKIAQLEWAKKVFKTNASIKRGFLYRLCLILGLAIIAVTIGLILKAILK